MDRCGLPLKGRGEIGLFNTAIYAKIVWCSFKSFEQCIWKWTVMEAATL